VAVAEGLALRLGGGASGHRPPLSRPIKQLKHRMGVTLLERSSRKVVLTEAGEMLFHEGREALDAMAALGWSW